MPEDSGKSHSRAITDGPSRAGARSMFKAVGFTDEDLRKPIIGIANTWTEVGPLQLSPARAGRRGERRRARGGRNADGVQHHRGFRRHHHGHGRHARLAGEPRGDCRFDRTGGARPHVRRTGGAVELRQDHPGHGDGAGTARYSWADALRRIDRARPLSGPRRQYSGCVRGDRQVQSGQDERGRAEGHGRPCLSGAGRVRRTVYRQHHVHRLRVPRYLSSRQQRSSRNLPLKN